MKIIANNYEPKDIIKFIRESTNKTQKDFAKDIGKSKDTVQSYELGRNKMSLDSFLSMAKKEGFTIIIEKTNFNYKDNNQK